MKNYRLTISYDGTRYHGWEYKKNVDTIQGKLEQVLGRLCDGEVKLIGAGRTDAGVHAQAMVANVHMDVEKTPEQIRDYMNRYLPDDIAITEAKEVSPRFHARYNAISKIYCYTCYDGPAKPVFQRRYVAVLEKTIDIKRMRAAAEYLIGEHDFKSFCGNSKMKKSTVRTIYSVEIERKGGYVTMQFHGNGFLQNMVRILCGTLIEVGYGRLKAEQMPEIMASLDRQMAGPTAPAQGLCLVEIYY
ncbi:MAG: tRNA pseudouridine(38-40) synthase TruA [Eubacteriales bacterium]|nr:tRNA pseudouridine(38-40) synthase TruA [Eubacteriales bacterium]